MDRDLDPREAPPGSPDDAQLGALVRAVADDWRRPPQRLGQPTWRDRVQADQGASGSGGRRWFGRLAGAGMLAVVATVVLSLTAVYLTGPRANQGGIGASASPSDGSAPSRSPGATASPAAASPLPALEINGALPSVTNVLMQVNDTHRSVDLATGTMQPDFTFRCGNPGKVLPRPGGGWVCVWITYLLSGSGSPSGLDIYLQAVDADGAAEGPVFVRTVTSEVAVATDDVMQVDGHVDASPDGRFAYIGSTHRTTTGWSAVIDRVDLASLQTVDTIAVPGVDHSADAAGRSWVGLAPSISILPDSDVFLISSDWWVDDPSTSTPPYGTDRWSGTFDESMPAAIPAAEPTDEGCGELDRGLIDDASFFVVCYTPSGNLRVDRHELGGSTMDRTDVGRSTGFGAQSMRVGSYLFLWDPQAHALVRYDLRTAETDRIEVPATGGVEGPLDSIGALGRAVGHWLAPTAVAKVQLQPALAISPDGTTLYALGVEGAIESSGSTGIYAFDISGDSLSLKGHWDPTADFNSLAVSPDGAFVYAAGLAGVDAQGHAAPYLQASVTVFDAADGSIRLIAGQLGAGNQLMFVESVVR